MKLRVLTILGALSLAGSVSATPINVAAGQNVILNGTYGVLTNMCCGWNPAAPLAAGSTLVDEILKAPASVWNDDTVWWDAMAPGSGSNSVEIALGGLHLLTGFTVQADDNDSYLIEYLDSSNTWIPAWNIPAVGGFGTQTRPNPLDPTDIFYLGTPVVTNRLRFSATGGDGFYSVSEIKAFTPEPGMTTLLLVGLVGLASRRVRGKA